MRRKMGYRWQLRQLMAARGMFQTSRLGPLLAERGIHLSREQVYRLVAGTPQRLSLDVLAALCDILGCTPADLITVEVTNIQVPKQAASSARRARPSAQRTTICRPRHDGR
jgi:DNA-binding Xre family transcriptional regulator